MDGNNLNIHSKYIISIVVPCYNCESTLDETVNSLLKQDIEQRDEKGLYQIVLVDDGSEDSTSSRCDYYSQSNLNIKVIHKRNGGLVSAWKAGVDNSEGEYIAFCDSDDYIDSDFVCRITSVINMWHPDIITFGMITEYNNGEKVYNDILLEEGMYNRQQLVNDLYPILFSNGDMQSELIGSSRCNKVFIRRLFESIEDDVPNNVSFGEDDLTCFASILNADSIFSIRDYYPYHYIRNNVSMIGSYDPHTFDKIDILYRELMKISSKYKYSWSDQVKREVISILFLNMKKEICRNPGSFKEVRSKLIHVIKSDMYKDCFSYEIINNYKIFKRLFAVLIDKHCFVLVFVLTKILEGIRGRNV